MSKKICVIGAGRWGRNHIRTLNELGHLGGVTDSNEEVLAGMVETYPGIQTFNRLRDALEGPFDGFVVATPAATHYRIAEQVLRKRKPVLVEKPLALKASEARRLQSLAVQQEVNLMVGHVLLFHPAIRKIKELIQSGKVGKPEYIYSNRLNLGTVRTEENILWSFAPHDISIFQYLTESFPTEIVSKGGAFLQPHIQDTTMTMLAYPGNLLGHIFVSWLHPFKEHRLVIIGTKGMFSFEDSSGDDHILFYEKGIDWVKGEPIQRDGPTEAIPFNGDSPLAEELRYFLDHLNSKSVKIADAQNGVEVLEILEKATESLLTGQAAYGAKAAGSSCFIHHSSFVDDDVEIGDGTKIWHFCHIQSHSRIGRNCTLGQNVNVGNHVKIGNHVKVQNNVSIYEGVELEDYVFCGPSMVFTNIKDPRSKYPQRGSKAYRPTFVREGASIGANATVVCGNTIGRHSFIAAGAVVSADVPDYALMMGVPAVQKGWVCECGRALPEFNSGTACPRCARRYQLKTGRLIPVSEEVDDSLTGSDGSVVRTSED